MQPAHVPCVHKTQHITRANTFVCASVVFLLRTGLHGAVSCAHPRPPWGPGYAAYTPDAPRWPLNTVFTGVAQVVLDTCASFTHLVHLGRPKRPPGGPSQEPLFPKRSWILGEMGSLGGHLHAQMHTTNAYLGRVEFCAAFSYSWARVRVLDIGLSLYQWCLGLLG